MSITSEQERTSRMNCGKLLSNLGDNVYDCVTVWSDSSHGYLVVNSINEYDDKKEEIKKAIIKLSMAAVASLAITASLISISDQIISEPVKIIVGTMLVIFLIYIGSFAIKDAIYVTKIKEYLKAAKEYLKNYKPELFETLEGKKKVRKISST